MGTELEGRGRHGHAVAAKLLSARDAGSAFHEVEGDLDRLTGFGLLQEAALGPLVERLTPKQADLLIRRFTGLSSRPAILDQGWRGPRRRL